MSDERQLSRILDAPWLPPGSSAEVWVGDDCDAPDPAIVTRLLLLRRNSSGVLEFFCVPTPRGPNLPTRYLALQQSTQTLEDGTRRLMLDVFSRTDIATRCVGFIRNVVPTPDTSYTYPSPWAHVPVFLITEAAQPMLDGEWFGSVRGRAELSERHWWPIVEHCLAAK